MNKTKAKLKFGPNTFEVLEKGDYVNCAVSGKNIPLQNLEDRKSTRLNSSHRCI